MTQYYLHLHIKMAASISQFPNFECKYLENQKWYWKTINGVLFHFIRYFIWDQHDFWVNFPFDASSMFTDLATINLNAYISSFPVSIDFWLFFSFLISVHCLFLEMGSKNPSEKLMVLIFWVHSILFWQPLFFTFDRTFPQIIHIVRDFLLPIS